MEITYKTNGVPTTEGMTEWYFGKKFTVEQSKAAIEMSGVSKRNSFKFFQQGTGYLTIEIR